MMINMYVIIHSFPKIYGTQTTDIHVYTPRLNLEYVFRKVHGLEDIILFLCV